jgi:hypothetical protein
LHCSPAVALPWQGPKILAHIAAHILHDSHVKRSDEPCGLCLRPSPLCRFYLRKGKGAGTSNQVDFAKSTCEKKITFSYAIASESSPSSPSSNVPIYFPVCPTSERCVWRYNLPYHMRNVHPSVSLTPYEDLWTMTNTEKQLLAEVWRNHHRQKKTRKSKKAESPPLVISEAHSSRLTLRYAIPSVLLTNAHV